MDMLTEIHECTSASLNTSHHLGENPDWGKGRRKKADVNCSIFQESFLKLLCALLMLISPTLSAGILLMQKE